MQEVRIENWSIVSPSSFIMPELQSRVLQGKVFGHPRFNDNSPVSTSTIIEIDLEVGFIITRNTKYILGKIDNEYLNHCISANYKDLQILKKYKEVKENV